VPAEPGDGAPAGGRIRLATPADGAAIAAIYAPAVLDGGTTFEYLPPDADEMARRVARVQARTPWLVFERAGDVTAYAYAGPHRERPAYQWSVETSVYVARGAQRSGVARRLYRALLELLALQGFQNAYAGITLPNPASEAFHRAMGFELVGVYRGIGYKQGRWRDVAWYERAVGPRPAEPPPPIPLPELRDTPGFAAILAGLPRAGARALAGEV